MALRRKTIRGQLGTSTAVLLAASASVTRYVRGVTFLNCTAATRTINYAHAATATSSGPGIFGETLPANTQGYLAQRQLNFPGQGSRLDNTAISGFADAAGVSYEIQYDESDTVDA